MRPIDREASQFLLFSAVFVGFLALAGCSGSSGNVGDTATSNDGARAGSDSSIEASLRDATSNADVVHFVDGGISVDGTGTPTGSMRLISRTVPSFSSSGPTAFRGPQNAQDNDPLNAWQPTSLPGWIAYDISGVPVAQRQNGLVAWYAIHSGGYLNTNPGPDVELPMDYTIEVNMAAGGGNPPADGWSTLITATGNTNGTAQHLVAFNGANWVRMRITRSSDPAGGIEMDFDVYSAPNGATDSWMFMGDSITFITFPYAFCDLPKLVQMANPDRWPAVINAAIGGTNSGTALGVIDATIANFPGRYVVLAYGTNDHVDGYEANMEMLVMRVIAAGKIPVIPHIPWSTAKLTEGPAQNAAIDDLYARYPAIVHGPDLWAFFENRSDLIPTGDVHPNGMGQEALRQQWSAVLLAVP